jgi:hypothetical protein
VSGSLDQVRQRDFADTVENAQNRVVPHIGGAPALLLLALAPLARLRSRSRRCSSWRRITSSRGTSPGQNRHALQRYAPRR